MTRCSLCSHEREKRFQAVLLESKEANYYYCSHCGLLQTESPYWLEEAYREAIAVTDTGLVQRNIHISTRLVCLLYFLFGEDGKYLDVAGGYGLLARLMRDSGFDFYWSDKYCENIFAKGFESSTTHPPFTAVTAFEVIEHVYDPLRFLRDVLSESGSGTIIFSTELFDGEPPGPGDWWYYALNTGQHISFYQRRTLRYISEQLGMYLYSSHSLHMLTDRKILPSIFRVLTSRFSLVYARYVRRFLFSKTFPDHEKLVRLRALGSRDDP